MENLVKLNLETSYKNKKVLITGHTGFKGSWLSIWLNKIGANVIGYALDPVNKKDNFSLSGISNKIVDIRGDIRDKEKLAKVFEKEKPEIVFHMAAQALVIEGYNDPVYTYETNLLGTVNVLECIRMSKSVHTAIFITTDKVYENKEWVWPYRETDTLGGYDPYSSSKGASELIISSYRNSFFNKNKYEVHKKSIASVRAGNVIGGGDWSKNRLIPDCIKSIEKNKVIEIRSPRSIRPWQHVLEPLFGYLLLGIKMMEEPLKYGESWNFGPENEDSHNVGAIVSKLIDLYGQGEWNDISNPNDLHEAKNLTLDITKSKSILNWKPILDIDETLRYTIDWYKNYMSIDVHELCMNQIDKYSKLQDKRNDDD